MELGFRQGGPAGYGLARQLIDQNRQFKQALIPGGRKSLQTDRVILVPGPEHEIEIVRTIYKWFIEGGMSEREIANLLNSRGVHWEPGRPWTRGIVHQILTNHKYIGSNVFNRASNKLKLKRVKNPRSEWVYKEEAFAAIIPVELFERVQTIIAVRHVHLSDDELLSRLKSLFEANGYLSGFLIDETDGMPSSSQFSTRFGSLPRAYSLVGWTPHRDYRFIDINRAIRRKYADVVNNICSRLQQHGAAVQRDEDTDLLLINGEYTASVVLARCQTTRAGTHRWMVRFDAELAPDITIAARLTPENDAVLDYYLLPSLGEIGLRVRLNEENPLALEVYRFDDLEFFTQVARRTRTEDVA